MGATRVIVSSAIALVVAAACGQASDSSPNASVTSDDIATYQELTSRVQDGAASYRATMMAPGTTTAAECRRVHDAYDREVRPWVSRMVHMGGEMDRYMEAHGGANMADYACVSATMMDELDHHHATACTFSDIGADRTEAIRHVDAMLSYGSHMWDRCDQMMRGIDSGSWGWGPMMGGCEIWDGHCSGMMHEDCCGGMMGGMHGDRCDW
jgi:hypothetical protein